MRLEMTYPNFQAFLCPVQKMAYLFSDQEEFQDHGLCHTYMSLSFHIRSSYGFQLNLDALRGVPDQMPHFEGAILQDLIGTCNSFLPETIT